MLKAFCDAPDCGKPIAPSDDHLEIPHLVIVDKREGMQMKALHFCGGKSCLCKYLDKAFLRPLLVNTVQ